MLRRFALLGLATLALSGCVTYDGGYRERVVYADGSYYYPSGTGYGDYYARRPDYYGDYGYYAPAYARYPSYYSLYWGLDRRYYRPYHYPYFHYGVTWFPSNWFGVSFGYGAGSYYRHHPYAPYRWSWWDSPYWWSPYRYGGHDWHDRHDRHDPRPLQTRDDYRIPPRHGVRKNARDYTTWSRERELSERESRPLPKFDGRPGRVIDRPYYGGDRVGAGPGYRPTPRPISQPPRPRPTVVDRDEARPLPRAGSTDWRRPPTASPKFNREAPRGGAYEPASTRRAGWVGPGANPAPRPHPQPVTGPRPPRVAPTPRAEPRRDTVVREPVRRSSDKGRGGRREAAASEYEP